MQIITDVVVSLLICYAVYCVMMFMMQRRVMYPRYLIPAPSGDEDNIPGLEKIWLHTGAGKVEAWFIPPDTGQDKKPSPVVIFAHGNGDVIDFWADALRSFPAMGVGVLIVEYPGYGRSEGYPSEKNIAETFEKAYDTLLTRKDVDPSKVVLFGSSLGGGAVCCLSEKRPSSALILMSTFTSARSFATRYLVPGFLVLDTFDNLSAVRDYSNPVLIIHGRLDDTIPYSHGVSLYKSAKNAEMITYDCGHNDCPPRWDMFWKDIRAFLEKADIL